MQISVSARRGGSRPLFLCAAALCVLCGAQAAYAQKRPPGQVNKKALHADFGSFNSYSYDINSPSTLDDIVGDGANSGSYSPLTLAQLRLMKEVAQPSYRPEDYDPDLTRRVGNKMVAIQTGRAVSEALQKSELQQTYRSALRSIKALQARFRYAVQSDGEGLKVSRRDIGRKLMELNLDFNLRQGFDPQIRFGEYFRLRYDYIGDRAMLEYGFEF